MSSTATAVSRCWAILRTNRRGRGVSRAHSFVSVYPRKTACACQVGATPVVNPLAATQAAAVHPVAQIPGLQGLWVPSIAYLDRHDHFSVVVYRDAVDPAAVFGQPAHEADITLAADSG